MSTLEKITANIKSRYPVFLEDGVTIKDYCFWDCARNQEIPVKEEEQVKNYLVLHEIKDFALVVFFSNDIIGYRLNI